MTGAGLQSLVGLRVGLVGKGGCLCTISANKAIVVRAHSEGSKEPLAEKEETFQSPYFVHIILLISLPDLT